MNHIIHVDREAVEGFIELMHLTTTNMASTRGDIASSYAGGDGSSGGKWRDGVKVTVGVIDYPHAGRVAGELLADRISETLDFVVSLEEGARALGFLAQQVLDNLTATDEISSEVLAEIMNSVPQSSDLSALGIDGGMFASGDSYA